MWPIFPSVTLFCKFEAPFFKHYPIFQVWPICSVWQFCSQKAAYHLACERRSIFVCRLSPPKKSRALIAWNFLFYRHPGSFFFNSFQAISNRVATITVFLSPRLKPRWTQWIHELGICIRQIRNINFCNVSFEWRIGITWDELSWFMKPFARYGESNLDRTERRSANVIDRGEQNMDSPSCSSSHHAYVLWSNFARCISSEASGCNINYLNFFITIISWGRRDESFGHQGLT